MNLIFMGKGPRNRPNLILLLNYEYKKIQEWLRPAQELAEIDNARIGWEICIRGLDC